MKKKLLSLVKSPLVYYRYVDDTFAVFPDEDQRSMFERELNNLHPCLKFTSELENDKMLPFLDVQVVSREGRFLTQVYRKPHLRANIPSDNTAVI